MRQLEPFSYFIGRASAIPGFGGFEPSPDPRYCFHTQYEAVRPGRAIYHLKISGARASRGELALRVHAHRRDNPDNVVLAGGGRLDLGALASDAVELPVRFSAIPDTHYALYGYLSEPSDLVAEAIEIAIEELGEQVESRPAEARYSRIANGGSAFDPINKLCTDRPPSVLYPVSQPCTQEQLQAGALDALWPSLGSDWPDPVERWKLAMPLQALDCAGMLVSGSRGVILNAPHPALARTLRERGCSVGEPDAGNVGDGSGQSGGGGEAGNDFAIGFEDSPQAAESSFRGSLPERLMDHVLADGLVIAMLSPRPGETGWAFRNRMQQIALRLIGLQHDVAQLCFPRQPSSADEAPADAPFIFVARK